MTKLKRPLNGEIVSLLTEAQLEFIKSDRSALNAEDFDYLNLKRSGDADLSLSGGVNFEWEANKQGNIQISESSTFKTYYSCDGNGECSVYNLKCDTSYFWRVVCADEISDTFCFHTSKQCPRFIKIDGLTNVRDCGGWQTYSGSRIRQGLLYRGCEMNSHLNILPSGLLAMRDVLKIKSILDLRRDSEIVEDVYGGNYLNVPAWAYREWFEHPDSAKKIFGFLSDESNYPVYFHCWGGADRTGTLAFLLGALLGMNYDDLIDDYETTSLSVWGTRTRNSEKSFAAFWKHFNTFEGTTPAEKAKNYFLTCGVSNEMIEEFKKIMLEGKDRECV